MPRAYTKSGSTEKYESSQWSIYWKGNTGTCTGPDASTGEYTITAPSGMSITSTKNDTSYCLTIYGGVQNWFYFERNTITIDLRIYIKLNNSNNGGDVVINWNNSKEIIEILNIVKPKVSGYVSAYINRKLYSHVASFNTTITGSSNGETLTSFYTGDIGTEYGNPMRRHFLEDLSINNKSSINGTAAGYNYIINV